MTYRGVFFDLYGTLLIYGDLHSAWSDWLSAIHQSLGECGFSVSKALLTSRCDGFFARPVPLVQEDGLTVLERRIQALCADLGVNVGPKAIQKTATACVRAWQRHHTLDPDAIPVLQTLRPKTSLALISNFDHPSHVTALLSELGLAEFFDAVIVSGAVGVEKPDPRIFSLALQQTGLRPAEVVYVGDTAADVTGSRAAGLCPIRIRRSGLRDTSDITDFKSIQQSPREETEEPTKDGVKVVARLVELVEIL